MVLVLLIYKKSFTPLYKYLYISNDVMKFNGIKLDIKNNNQRTSQSEGLNAVVLQISLHLCHLLS